MTEELDIQFPLAKNYTKSHIVVLTNTDVVKLYNFNNFDVADASIPLTEDVKFWSSKMAAVCGWKVFTFINDELIMRKVHTVDTIDITKGQM